MHVHQPAIFMQGFNVFAEASHINAWRPGQRADRVKIHFRSAICMQKVAVLPRRTPISAWRPGQKADREEILLWSAMCMQKVVVLPRTHTYKRLETGPEGGQGGDPFMVSHVHAEGGCVTKDTYL